MSPPPILRQVEKDTRFSKQRPREDGNLARTDRNEQLTVAHQWSVQGASAGVLQWQLGSGQYQYPMEEQIQQKWET
jgi:hypothetical protein